VMIKLTLVKNAMIFAFNATGQSRLIASSANLDIFCIKIPAEQTVLQDCI